VFCGGNLPYGGESIRGFPSAGPNRRPSLPLPFAPPSRYGNAAAGSLSFFGMRQRADRVFLFSPCLRVSLLSSVLPVSTSPFFCRIMVQRQVPPIIDGRFLFLFFLKSAGASRRTCFVSFFPVSFLPFRSKSNNLLFSHGIARMRDFFPATAGRCLIYPFFSSGSQMMQFFWANVDAPFFFSRQCDRVLPSFFFLSYFRPSHIFCLFQGFP